MKKRADQIKAGDVVEGCKVESIRHFGPMLGEAYGYARNVEMHLAPHRGWMIPGSVKAVRGDILLSVGE
jgi:tmRNA-binding protein